MKFYVFGHGIGIAQLFVGLLGLGIVGISGARAVSHFHQRTTNKFLSSLFSVSRVNVSQHKFLKREAIANNGKNNFDSTKSIALIGDHRCGKTVFLSQYIIKSWFPWYRRFLSPPRGLFLEGSRNEATIADWLKVQISAQKDSPLAALNDILYQRRSEQRIRVFLEDTFGPRLPKILRPQPSVIIVDQAEELLRAYRAEFLLFFYNLGVSSRTTFSGTSNRDTDP